MMMEFNVADIQKGKHLLKNPSERHAHVETIKLFLVPASAPWLV